MSTNKQSSSLVWLATTAPSKSFLPDLTLRLLFLRVFQLSGKAGLDKLVNIVLPASLFVCGGA
jgi:hypothetical protein